MLMRLSVRYCACAAAFFCATESMREGVPARVHLGPARSEYVLGEPVVLSVSVNNVGNQSIKTWVESLKYQIQIYIAGHGEQFREFTGESVIFGGYDVSPNVEALKPGASRVYHFRVLYTPDSIEPTLKPWHLAFDKPGDYRVKACYPLYPKRETFESNTIEIRIKEPEGVDAKVWEQINSPELLYLLQAGYVRGEHRNNERMIVAKAFRLFQGPRSSYHPALEYALKEVYEEHRMHMSEELNRLRAWRWILGIEEPLPFVPNPKVWVRRKPG